MEPSVVILLLAVVAGAVKLASLVSQRSSSRPAVSEHRTLGTRPSLVLAKLVFGLAAPFVALVGYFAVRDLLG